MAQWRRIEPVKKHIADVFQCGERPPKELHRETPKDGSRVLPWISDRIGGLVQGKLHGPDNTIYQRQTSRQAGLYLEWTV